MARRHARHAFSRKFMRVFWQISLSPALLIFRDAFASLPDIGLLMLRLAYDGAKSAIPEGAILPDAAIRTAQTAPRRTEILRNT